ncbi:MAG: hypothetical protein OQJ96_10305 [Flavobacteriales bacterium]|nr:hypothetical protein [Flavobacteriales bacterium]MCW8913422.1 hypothetical protein [Flavobacteriales bacterium]MCW8938514.1 hypothetical protein [Flavobacteriales bacterium]MCW8940132.1 hypothetical protein [Flavobacteriales bacterium]MCW8967467.1 hypothetical protein [Flavobacteriales bacterium]
MHYIKKNSLVNKFKAAFYIVVLIITNSCSKDNFEAKVPSYITIDNFTVTSNYAVHGSSSSNITDVWVYINDDLVGTYELPARFPVIKEGTYNVKFYAGIKDNGVSGLRERYLFYTPHEEQITFEKGKEIKIEPKVSYISSTKTAWLEDFESPSTSFTYSTGSDTIINKTNTSVFEGNASGYVYLQSYMDFFEAKSPVFSNVSSLGSPVYLELNFKTNEPILVGLKTDDDNIGIVNLNTTSTWKKIYINLTPAISQKSANTNFYVFFGIQSSGLSPFQTSNPEFYLDNIKILHY